MFCFRGLADRYANTSVSSSFLKGVLFYLEQNSSVKPTVEILNKAFFCFLRLTLNPTKNALLIVSSSPGGLNYSLGLVRSLLLKYSNTRREKSTGAMPRQVEPSMYASVTCTCLPLALFW